MKPTMVKALTFVMALLLLPVSTFAASEAPGWLEEKMFASGKINTVVMVVSVVLIGIAIWMFAMDRRIGRLEKWK
jgi:cytochrome bd-type quinol oxidase subunit 2